MIGLVVLFLTIFGVDLIRRASTYMGVVILVLAVSIYTVGLLMGTIYWMLCVLIFH